MPSAFSSLGRKPTQDTVLLWVRVLIFRIRRNPSRLRTGRYKPSPDLQSRHIIEMDAVWYLLGFIYIFAWTAPAEHACSAYCASMCGVHNPVDMERYGRRYIIRTLHR